MADPVTESLGYGPEYDPEVAALAPSLSTFMDAAGIPADLGPVVASLPKPTPGAGPVNPFMNGYVPQTIGPTPPSQIEKPPTPLIPAAPRQPIGGMFDTTPRDLGIGGKGGTSKIVPAGGKTETITTELSPEQKANMEELGQIGERRKEVAERGRAAEAEKANAHERYSAELASVQEKQQAEDRKLVEQQNSLIQRSKAEYDEAVKERQGLKFTSLLSRASTGRRAVIAIAKFLGRIGSGPDGTNPATEALRNAINDDFEVQRQSIANANEKV